MRMSLKKIILVIGLSVVSAYPANAQLVDSMDQYAEQSRGNYQPMNLSYAGFNNSLCMIQSAWQDPLQNLGEGQSKPAYSKYYWSPDLVLPIRLREAMITLVNFPEWEMVEDIYIGDNKSFAGQISGPNTILLYPQSGTNVGVDTNIRCCYHARIRLGCQVCYAYCRSHLVRWQPRRGSDFILMLSKVPVTG